VAKPSTARFLEVFKLVEAHIETRYEIPVRITDVAAPFTGDLNGAEIHVDFKEDVENALFIVAHLFGHTVQWNLCADAREIGSVIHENPSDELIKKLCVYEEEACGYSMQLLHDLGVHDLDQWLSDFSACDLAYLTRFYKTGEKVGFMSLWVDGTPVMPPIVLPDFHPTQWISRWEGVVV